MRSPPKNFKDKGPTYLRSSTMRQSAVIDSIGEAPSDVINSLRSKTNKSTPVTASKYSKHYQILHSTPISSRVRYEIESRCRSRTSRGSQHSSQKNSKSKKVFERKESNKELDLSPNSSIEIFRGTSSIKYFSNLSSSEGSSSSEVSCPNTYTNEAIAELEHPALDRVLSCSSDMHSYPEISCDSVKIKSIVLFQDSESLEKNNSSQISTPKSAIRRHTWSSFTHEGSSTCNPRFMIMSSFSKENFESFNSSPLITSSISDQSPSSSRNVFGSSFESISSSKDFESIKDEFFASTSIRMSKRFLSSQFIGSYGSESLILGGGTSQISETSSLEDLEKNNLEILMKSQPTNLKLKMNEESEEIEKDICSQIHFTKTSNNTDIGSRQDSTIEFSSPLTSSSSEKRLFNPNKTKPKMSNNTKEVKDKVLIESKTPKGKNPRTKSGCWTCRARRKKCSEQFSSNCSLCQSLGLECLGYSVKKPGIIGSPKKLRKYLDCVKERVSDFKSKSKLNYQSSKVSKLKAKNDNEKEGSLIEEILDEDSVISGNPVNNKTSIAFRSPNYEENGQEFQVVVITPVTKGRNKRLLVKVIWSHIILKKISKIKHINKGLTNDQVWQHLKS